MALYNNRNSKKNKIKNKKIFDLFKYKEYITVVEINFYKIRCN